MPLADKGSLHARSTKRRRTRSTVRRLTSTASAMRSSVQAGPTGAASSLVAYQANEVGRGRWRDWRSNRTRRAVGASGSSSRRRWRVRSCKPFQSATRRGARGRRLGLLERVVEWLGGLRRRRVAESAGVAVVFVALVEGRGLEMDLRLASSDKGAGRSLRLARWARASHAAVRRVRPKTVWTGSERRGGGGRPTERRCRSETRESELSGAAFPGTRKRISKKRHVGRNRYSVVVQGEGGRSNAAI